MSAGRTSSGLQSGVSHDIRIDRIRGPHYDEVAVDPPVPLQETRESNCTLNSEPLPPPPLPIQPPVGAEFYPSENDEPVEDLDLKPIRRFIPDSWKNFFRGSKNKNQWEMPNLNNHSNSDGVQCSPPASPTPSVRNQKSVASSYRDPYGGSGGSYNSRKDREVMIPHEPYDSLDRRTYRTAMTYSEKLEAYEMKYSFMKSWPGLLRILCIFELLLGAAVFACVCAYIHKDNEWYNMFGYSQPYSYAGSSMSGGYYYSGPKTPFILVVAGLAWIVTVILLVLGMTMYYRAILLGSNWWPLTEFGLNVSLFILYLSAAIVYVNDINRGGLCYYPLFNNGINGAFCRIEGGQTAGAIFLFVTMFIYIISAIVCLKLWRHEAAKKFKKYMEQEMKSTQITGQNAMVSEVPDGQMKPQRVVHKEYKDVEVKPEILNGHIPSGYIPKPLVMPDYIAKYPTIHSTEERDRYKAVFNDQYSEYKELNAEVQAMSKKIAELDAMVKKLPHFSENKMEHERINKILEEFQRKKNDPSFLEKKERCEYLKNKLSHIKQKIQEYDKVMDWNDGY
ncbi:MARVEL domain-containing protein 2 [Erpetoichthys calabaricus]|uniref:MARVEL domain containing 2b n=1 Tax=Erpetoichthys calabaricus TaxID=27687 RepID=A0A8C4T8S4_ERPCA|nr:MARVEL domain-containing protein 2 [Erpetoichthys calabaricus]XP_051786059.1 MARVEL domain-containing protein 2 [Erpetoichthys calabaricus]XP_051786060.1 MARVEL domain-containing protein 2 [Erpetoichthys calabaricus]